MSVNSGRKFFIIFNTFPIALSSPSKLCCFLCIFVNFGAGLDSLTRNPSQVRLDPESTTKTRFPAEITHPTIIFLPLTRFHCHMSPEWILRSAHATEPDPIAATSRCVGLPVSSIMGVNISSSNYSYGNSIYAFNFDPVTESQ